MKTAKSNCSIRLKRSLAVNLSIMCAFIFREMPSRNRWGPLLKRHFSYTNLGCLNIHRLVSVDNLKYVLKASICFPRFMKNFQNNLIYSVIELTFLCLSETLFKDDLQPLKKSGFFLTI